MSGEENRPRQEEAKNFKNPQPKNEPTRRKEAYERVLKNLRSRVHPPVSKETYERVLKKAQSQESVSNSGQPAKEGERQREEKTGSGTGETIDRTSLTPE